MTPAFPLETETVDGPGTPERAAIFLHGILGSGRNWRGFARDLAGHLPGWRLVLADLRNHGATGKAPPPQTVAACADDVLGVDPGVPVDVIVGHSFGGKVALDLAARRESRLSTVFVVDAVPSALPPPGDGELRAVFDALRRVPVPLPRRDAIYEALSDQPRSIADWMTTNLRPTADGFVWKFDLPACTELVGDYFQRDLWGPIEATSGPDIHVVRAGRSERWTAPILARFDALPDGARGRLHTLRDAGHWIHIDDPAGLQALLRATWPR